MHDNLKQLLDALEQNTTTLAPLVDTLSAASLDWTALEDPIQRRGVLVEQLNRALTRSSAIADSEYDRLLTIRREGEQISSRLQTIRSQLVLQTTGQTARHAYRHCLEGMISSKPPVLSINQG
jgi:hypothetical protein